MKTFFMVFVRNMLDYMVSMYVIFFLFFLFFYQQIMAFHKMESSYFGEGLTLIGERFVNEFLSYHYFPFQNVEMLEIRY